MKLTEEQIKFIEKNKRIMKQVEIAKALSINPSTVSQRVNKETSSKYLKYIREEKPKEGFFDLTEMVRHYTY
jgi:Mn-dependent DtxR family transcriptional regulator